MKWTAIFLLAFLLLPSFVFAQSAPDLGIYSKDIRFSTDPLIVGDFVRIYAEIQNEGDTDALAYVFFYQGEIPIGASQTVTVAANGDTDTVWVDFVVPASAFNIRAELRGQDPGDVNSANDLAITSLLTAVQDSDDDGIQDEEDNCPSVANSSQSDQDSDGVGDVCDSDADGNGVEDNAEGEENSQPEETTVEKESTPEASVAENNEVNQQEEPEEADEQEEVQEEIETTEPVQVAAPAESDTLETSARAAFTYEQIGWRNYSFSALHPEDSSISFRWDFGDGVQSAQPVVDHQYRNAGTYEVTLSVIDEFGNTESRKQEITTTFFHMENPIVQFLIGILGLTLLSSLLLVLFRTRKTGDGKKRN